MKEQSLASRKPLVSVILPVFNGGRFLKSSIDSVIGQGFENIELLIWNDGSEDDSASVIESYHDERVRKFVSTENQGLFRTLNLLIAQATGDLIKLWSQDDVMKTNCVAESVKFMERHPSVGMAYSAYDIIADSGELLRAAPVDLTPEVIAPNVAAQIMFYHGSITGNIANVMIRRSALEAVGLFREDLVVSGDFEMWVRLAEVYPLGFIKEPLILLRSHRGQFSRRNGIYIQFMREDFDIIQTLVNRLPTQILDHARRYDRRHRQVQYVHHFLRCLLSGDWDEARGAYREIARFGGFAKLLIIWFVTLNQRLFRMKPLYDNHSPLKLRPGVTSLSH
jgi:glycosyltransferase involved in cell wall biosynthesis